MYLSTTNRSPPRPAPPGYQWVYETDGLSGLGRFRLRKIIRKVGRVAVAPFKAVYKVSKKIVKSKTFRKVAPIALVAVGAYFAAPWFLKVASVIGKGAATMLLQRGAQGAPEITQEEAQAQASSQQPPEWFAQAAQAYMATKAVSAATKAESAKVAPPGVTPFVPSRPATITPVTYAPQEIPGQPPESEAPPEKTLPDWVVPAGIGAGALLLFGFAAARPRGR